MDIRWVVRGGGWMLALVCSTAGAEVFQCVDADGRMLFTDGGCPPGYTVNLVVAEPPVTEDELVAHREEAEQRAAAADAERRAAEAENRRLRAQLEAERRRDGTQQDRIEALDRKLDSLLDRPQVYGGAALVPVPVQPWCGPGSRSRIECPPPRPLPPPPKARVYRPDPRDSCGTFGCTPGITHAPWDDDRGGVHRDWRDPYRPR